MELFTVDFDPAATPLYKGTRSPFDTQHPKTAWFALDVANASKYGPRVTQVRPSRRLRLLNVASHIFQYHFLDQMNLQDVDLRDKDLAVLPLGIPTPGFQLALAAKYISPPSHVPRHDRDPRVMHEAGYYMGHRLSDGAIDAHMVSMMAGIYGGTHDGYIQKRPVSSMWMDRFQSEVCLFRPAECGLSVVVGEHAVPASSGGGAGSRAPVSGSAASGGRVATGCGFIPDDGKKLHIRLDTKSRSEYAEAAARQSPEDYVNAWNASAVAALGRQGFAERELARDASGMIMYPSANVRIGRELGFIASRVAAGHAADAPTHSMYSEPPSRGASVKSSRRRGSRQ